MDNYNFILKEIDSSTSISNTNALVENLLEPSLTIEAVFVTLAPIDYHWQAYFVSNFNAYKCVILLIKIFLKWSSTVAAQNDAIETKWWIKI